MGRPVVMVGRADNTPDYKTYDFNSMRLAADAVHDAFRNTGLPEKAVGEADGLVTVPPTSVTVEYPIGVAQLLEHNYRLSLAFVNGGSSPVDALNTTARYISSGWADFLILCGGDNIGAFRRTQFTIYMSAMQLMMASLYNQREMDHDFASFNATYAIYGLANAARKNIPLADLRRSYAEMISAYSRVANKYGPARSKEIVSPEEVLESGEIATPFTKLMCANPRVVGGAAALLMSEEKARAYGIPEDRWVYWYGGGGHTDHKSAEEDKDFSTMWASKLAILEALAQAGIPLAEIEKRIQHFDIYSCFPSVVAGVVDALGMKFDNFERLTQAGGLARRGGAGSLYSLSALCAMYDRITVEGGVGLIYALGGALSSHSACVIGRQPVEVNAAPVQSDDLRETLAAHAAIPRVTVDPDPQGEAEIATYTVVYENPLKSAKFDPYPVCIGRRDNRQFIANLAGVDALELAKANPADIIGRTCEIGRGKKNTITMTMK